MRSRFLCLLIIIGFVLSSCGQSMEDQSGAKAETTWQEQYDLGIRYLSEGNYAEAIIAFTAAIEIDPKQASAYVGRGQAYIFSGETEDNLTAAQADYEKSIELDETNSDAYLGLADVYIRRGDYDKALEILREGLEKTGKAAAIAGKISEIESGSIADSSGTVHRISRYNEYGGELFETRSEFRDFEEIDGFWKELLVALAHATLDHDNDKLISLLNDGDGVVEAGNSKHIYTIWEGYKVGFVGGGVSEYNRERSMRMEFEMRPENGIGYKYILFIGKDLLDEGDYSCNISWYCANCEDWQWNGSVRGEKWEYSRTWWDYGGEWKEYYTTSEETGEIRNGLRTGLFTIISHQIADYFPGGSETFTSIVEYNDGKLISQDGNPPSDSSENYTMSLDDQGLHHSFTERVILDAIYW